MDEEIEIAEQLVRYAQFLGKTRNPKKRIAASRAEIRLQSELDGLRKETAPVPAGAGS